MIAGSIDARLDAYPFIATVVSHIVNSPAAVDTCHQRANGFSMFTAQAHRFLGTALSVVILTGMTACSTLEATEATTMTTEATPPPAIQAWMNRLTVPHAYDPQTGFIMARQTIALPPQLAEAPRIDDAVQAGKDENRLVIAFATANRCAPCQQFKKDALNDAR
ncbi:MAG: hypothetical protein AAF432_13365, partial [Planctomycetota bacterium]